MRVAAILLAAGQSRRFGRRNKLLATYQGKPLVSHAANAIRALKSDVLIAVTRSHELGELLPDFQRAAPPANLPQSASLHVGIKAAKLEGAEMALIVLGDMPNVTPALLRALVERTSDKAGTAATDGANVLPPACFPKSLFTQLAKVDGDKGAREVIARLPRAQRVLASPEELRDIDEPADLY